MKIEIEVPEGYTVILQKKPETRWFRAFRYQLTNGYTEIDSYSGQKETDKRAMEREAQSRHGFIGWITEWTEYTV